MIDDRGPTRPRPSIIHPASHPPSHHHHHTQPQLFYSFFKKLVGKEVAVELKNDVELTGRLHSVDQYLNIKLEDVQVVKKERYPQLVRLSVCFVWLGF